MTAVLAPPADASTAALSPAPPAQIINTSCSCVWYSATRRFSNRTICPWSTCGCTSRRTRPRTDCTMRIACGGEHQRAHADAEVAVEPERLPHIVRQQHDEDHRQVEKIAMDVLDDQREG